MAPPRPAATPEAAIAQQTPAPRDPAAPLRQPQRRVPSAELFRGAVEVEIVHHQHVYRLRQTALGKLILTK